jgi:hypothetical protein
MPELHALTPILAVLQDRGHKVALVTDGRMSGASGKVPSAIHVAPEALDGGLIGKLHDGDLIRVDATTGTLAVLTEGVADRPAATPISPAMAGAWAASSSRSSATAPDRPPPARPPSSDPPKGKYRPDPLHLSPNTHAEGDRAAEAPCGRGCAPRPDTRPVP